MRKNKRKVENSVKKKKTLFFSLHILPIDVSLEQLECIDLTIY